MHRCQTVPSPSSRKAPQSSTSSLPLASVDSRPLRKRASGRPSLLQLGRPSSSTHQKRRRVIVRRERYEATTRAVDSPGRRKELEGSLQPSASSRADTFTKARGAEPKWDLFADPVPDTMPVGYDSAGCLGRVPAPTSLVLSRPLPSALRNGEVDRTHFSLFNFSEMLSYKARIVPLF